jgi:hypothetical protein
VELTGIIQTSKPYEMYLPEDPIIVQAIVDYLYTSDYDDSPASTSADEEHPYAKFYPSLDKTWDPRLYFNSRVYYFAREYQISALTEFALGKFLSVAEQFPRPHENVLGGRYLPSKTFLDDVMDACWSVELVSSEEVMICDELLKAIVFDLKEIKRFEEWYMEVSSARESASKLEMILSKMPKILRYGRQRAETLAEEVARQSETAKTA